MCHEARPWSTRAMGFALVAFVDGCGAARRPAAPAPAPTPDATSTAPLADATMPDAGDGGSEAPPEIVSLPSVPSAWPGLRAGALGGSNVTVAGATCNKAGLFVELPASSKTTCGAPADCTLIVPLRIVNCTSEEIVPTVLDLKSEGASAALRRTAPEVDNDVASRVNHGGPTNVRVTLTGMPPIPAKSVATGLSAELGAGARWEVGLTAESRLPPGSSAFARSETEIVDRKLAEVTARARAERSRYATACRARGGNLEIVGGFAASEQCVVPFPDTGRGCHDKSQCRGECLLKEAVPLPNGKVRLDGKCSRLETTYGCAARIGHTPGGTGIVGRDEIPPSMCID